MFVSRAKWGTDDAQVVLQTISFPLFGRRFHYHFILRSPATFPYVDRSSKARRREQGSLYLAMARSLYRYPQFQIHGPNDLRLRPQPSTSNPPFARPIDMFSQHSLRYIQLITPAVVIDHSLTIDIRTSSQIAFCMFISLSALTSFPSLSAKLPMDVMFTSERLVFYPH
jgi:hypothetical protein